MFVVSCCESKLKLFLVLRLDLSTFANTYFHVEMCCLFIEVRLVEDVLSQDNESHFFSNNLSSSRVQVVSNKDNTFHPQLY